MYWIFYIWFFFGVLMGGFTLYLTWKQTKYIALEDLRNSFIYFILGPIVFYGFISDYRLAKSIKNKHKDNV